MIGRFAFGIRARLLIIVLLAMLPFAALFVYHAAREREAALAESRGELLALARYASGDLESRIGSARYLLQALAEAPAVRNGPAPACAGLLAAIVKPGQRYSNLLVVGASGELLCSALAVGGPVNYADREWFSRVLAARAPVIGKPVIGRTTGRSQLPVAWPVLGADGQVDRIVAAALELNWFGERFAGADFLPGMAMLIWDEEGNLLYRNPDREKLTGGRRADAPLIEAARRAKGDGIVATPGLDGVPRIYALFRPAAFSEPGLTLAFGVAEATVVAGADGAMQRSLALLALLAAAIFALAWRVSEISVRRPVARLAEASARLRAGDLTARAAGPVPAGEIGALMTQFNETAAALEARTGSLVRANRALKVLSECNQALVRAATEPQLLQNICDLIVRHGGYRFAWVGYAEQDAAKSVRPAARAGFEDGYLDGLDISWAEDERGRGPSGIAIRTGEPFAVSDIASDPRMAPWRDRALARGYASSIALPLVFEGRTLGVLNIYAGERNAFQEAEMPLLLELAMDLAYGIATARARAAQMRADTQLRLQAVALEAAADAIVITARDGTIRWVNRAFTQLTGYAAEEALGQNPRLLKSGLHEAGFYRSMWETLLSGRTWKGELVNRGKEGRLWNEDQTITPVRGRDGEITHFIAIKQDVTARKRIEGEIRALNDDLEARVAERTAQLEQANRAKSDFLANMSHELRTPLNAIIGFSELLKDGLLGELDAKQRGFVADIFGAGTHLLSLINDILDLSKVEAGMLELDLAPVDVAALLKASTLMVREKALAHGLRLQTEIDPALGMVQADERKLKQIVFNLLANAVKFTPDGGAVRLAARRCTRAEVALDGAMPARLLPLPAGEDGDFLEIAVSDTGAGIAEEQLGRLFEPFVQVDSALSRRPGGTGLGLSLVRRLAELHGGTVGVASRPGAGSRFCVWLPYAAGARAAGAVEPPPAAPARAAPLALVIEDEDSMADLIAAQLRAEGYAVMRAATAEEGLVRATKSRPDLITLDIFLPEMDGWEFLRRLKQMPALADTAVVIVTVSQDAEHGLALGARRVLQKPFTREELAAALAGLIEARPDGEPARVLVVDDNPRAVELVAAALEAAGCRVMRAYGGAEAIEVARRARPDLVILDLMMPEVSGFEVARVLREAEHTARIPILVLTAKDLSAEDRARLNGDVSAILEKAGFSRSELMAELRRAIAIRRAP